MATKKTPEELMIENAILKNNEQMRSIIKAELLPFTEIVGKMDSRLKAVEDELDEIKETIKPFTTFRRRAWGILITFILGGGAVAFILYEVSRFKGVQ